MATKHKSKAKESRSLAKVDILSNFTLPDSLPCSEIDFPILIQKKNKACWAEILEESKETYAEIEQYAATKQPPETVPPFCKTECDYIKHEVFPTLIPALEDALNKAEKWEALRVQKCFFNGIDHIAQELWTSNPRYPNRKPRQLHIFNMPWARDILKETPRPYHPKSWLWPEEYAATLIQKTLRQYLVQREVEVQEMRNFWKRLEKEHHMPDMDMNPMLARRFASMQYDKDT